MIENSYDKKLKSWKSWKLWKSCIEWNGVKQEKSNQRLRVGEDEIWLSVKKLYKNDMLPNTWDVPKWKEGHINWNCVAL